MVWYGLGCYVPPDMTMLAYKSRRMSTSHFMMVWKVLNSDDDDEKERGDDQLVVR